MGKMIGGEAAKILAVKKDKGALFQGDPSHSTTNIFLIILI